MEYSLDLLRIERNKFLDELNIALSKEEKDWALIIKNERLLEDLNRAIDLLCDNITED